MNTFPRWQLRFTRTRKGAEPEVLEFRCDDLGVGRAGSDLTLPSKIVSREHCQFRIDPRGNLLVTDLGSTNGTFVNDVRLAPHAPTQVQVDDVVRIGEWELRLDDTPEPVEKAMSRSAALEAARDRAALRR